MIEFKYDSYERRKEVRPIREYYDNMFMYLKKKYGTKYSDKHIEDVIQNAIKTKMKRPKLEIISHAKPGFGEIKSVDLLTYTSQIYKNKIISPSGSAYHRPSVEACLLRKQLSEKKILRKEQKKLMFKAKIAQDYDREKFYNFSQNGTKTSMNSAYGMNGSEYNPMFDMAGGSAITSVGRYSVMIGYAYTERMFSANLYLPTINEAINYIVIYLRHIDHELVAKTIANTGLYIPTVDDVMKYMMDCVDLYVISKEKEKYRLYSFIQTLSPEERAYVFYVGCLKHIIMFNDKKARSAIRKMFDPNTPVDLTLDPQALYKADETVIGCATKVVPDILGDMQVFDTVDKAPDVARQLLSYINNIENTFDSEFKEIFETFMRSRVCVPNIFSHPKMRRRCVVLSDTDSVIFTVKDWVQWYMGRIDFTGEAFHIVTFCAHVMTHVFEHAFALMSANVGCEGNDVYKIAMKNEFLYPLMLRMNPAKTYAAIATMQEGRILPKPAKDIKGKMLRGSDLSPITRAKTTEFLIDIMNDVQNKVPISAASLIGKVVTYEKQIEKSIKQGERSFFNVVPVRNKSDYSSDPMSTSYFYYELWEKVFAHKYGHMTIPNKVYSIPVQRGGKYLRSEEYLGYLKLTAPDIHARLVEFLAEYPKKSMSFIMIPMGIAIPDVIQPLINIRKLIYSNVSPFYLILQSFGITFQDKGTDIFFLLGDTYEPLNDPDAFTDDDKADPLEIAA